MARSRKSGSVTGRWHFTLINPRFDRICRVLGYEARYIQDARSVHYSIIAAPNTRRLSDGQGTLTGEGVARTTNCDAHTTSGLGTASLHENDTDDLYIKEFNLNQGAWFPPSASVHVPKGAEFGLNPDTRFLGSTSQSTHLRPPMPQEFDLNQDMQYPGSTSQSAHVPSPLPQDEEFDLNQGAWFLTSVSAHVPPPVPQDAEFGLNQDTRFLGSTPQSTHLRPPIPQKFDRNQDTRYLSSTSQSAHVLPQDEEFDLNQGAWFLVSVHVPPPVPQDAEFGLNQDARFHAAV